MKVTSVVVMKDENGEEKVREISIYLNPNRTLTIAAQIIIVKEVMKQLLITAEKEKLSIVRIEGMDIGINNWFYPSILEE